MLAVFGLNSIELAIILVIALIMFAGPVAVVVVVVIIARHIAAAPKTHLRPCPDCGRSLSPQATSCPHCGRPLASNSG